MPEAAAGLRVLLLEDDAADAALVQRTLAKCGLGIDVRWTRTREDFLAALEEWDPQVILSDYKLPAFDGMAALALTRERRSAVPFILVSGTIGEEMAVEALKSGATDYVLKDRLGRLELVLARALREQRERADRRKAESALRESQTQLIQSQKMEALGRLSGGIAHDFNNILTAITGYSEIALADKDLSEGLRADLKEILAAALRAAALTRQLLAFSRRQVFAPKVLDLNQSLAELDRMLQRIIGEDVKLILAPAPDLRRVRADADQIGQVILNLVVNARDAMPRGGTLTLRSENAELGASELHGGPEARPGSYVRLTVEDAGVGMDEETLSRIFEPFFTTKSAERGTGLGLSTVYGIVRQSGGFIEVASAPGRGSRFSVCLPAVDAAPQAVQKTPAPCSLRGTETVLLVDDDASVRVIARRMLEGLGYAVVEARDGNEALKEGLSPGRVIHLLMTDIVMNGLGGPELARRITAAKPACRVLFISGYADTALPEPPGAAWHFLAKPFSRDALVRKVREALDCPAA
ncbi:MAG: response regulator [Elusimicrobia bacterium]|nr:response regulator [Elusimicrobiota bacterium]